MKKGLVLVIALIMLFSFSVSAESVVSIKPEGEFYTDNETIAEVIGMSEDELSDYIEENNIIYIGVNKDNSKQIRVTSHQTDFSNNIININGLSDDKINALLPDIIGIESARGDIINIDGQKFIKTELRSNDSGGDYLLTEFITIADRKVFVLSFYTNADKDTEYIEKTFESYSSPYFVKEKNNENNTLLYIIVAAVVVFVAASVLLVITIIKDIKRKKTDS